MPASGPAANAKAAEIIADAETRAKKREAEADAYAKRVTSVVDKLKKELAP